MYWQNTDDDIQTRIKLKLGLEKARSTEYTQSLLFAISAAFGGIKEERPVQSGKHAEAVFTNLMGGKAMAGPESMKDKAFAGLDGAFERMEKVEPK